MELVVKEEMIPTSIIKVTTFNAVQNNGKTLLMITQAEVLEKSASIKGNPVAISNASGSSKPSSAASVKVESKVIKSEDSNPDHEMKDAVTSPTPKGPHSSQISSPPTVTKKPAATIPQSQGSTSIIPIQGLNPYISKWTIKARVITKQAVRTFSRKGGGGESRVFSVNLMDNTCDVKASFWNEAADRYEDTLVVGKCYTFSKGKTQMANRKFNDTKSEYELSFNGDCVVEQCEDSEAPSVAYNFCAIERLETMIGKVR
jgi:replication factor A1